MKLDSRCILSLRPYIAIFLFFFFFFSIFFCIGLTTKMPNNWAKIKITFYKRFEKCRSGIVIQEFTESLQFI